MIKFADNIKPHEVQRYLHAQGFVLVEKSDGDYEVRKIRRVQEIVMCEMSEIKRLSDAVVDAELAFKCYAMRNIYGMTHEELKEARAEYEVAQAEMLKARRELSAAQGI